LRALRGRERLNLFLWSRHRFSPRRYEWPRGYTRAAKPAHIGRAG
jgi:hypothetical protein